MIEGGRSDVDQLGEGGDGEEGSKKRTAIK
jgi:hypothetical protein